MPVRVKSIIVALGCSVLGLVTASTSTAQEKPAASAKPKQRSDVAVGAALARLDTSVTLVDVGPSPDVNAPAPSPSAPIVVAPAKPSGLTEISVATRASSDTAGQAREVTLTNDATNKRAPKPVASVRHQRKLALVRTMNGIAPAMEACRAENGSTVALTFAVRLEIAADGAVERAEAVSTPGPNSAKPAVDCAVRTLSSAKFGAPGGQGVLLTVPVQIPAKR